MNLNVITRETYLRVVEPWLEWVDRGECGFTVFDGRGIYRLKQFAEDKKLYEEKWGKNGLRVGIVDLENGLVDNNNQLALYVGRQFGLRLENVMDLEKVLDGWRGDDIRVLLFVIPGERLLEERRGIYHYLAYLHETFGISVILHFQTNVFSDRNRKKLSEKTCFVQNHSLNPIYPRRDQVKFCGVMCDEWGKDRLSRDSVDVICDACGDHMLLVKQCLRVVLFQNMSALKAVKHRSVVEKAGALYASLDEGLRQVLRDVVKGRVDVDKGGLDFLVRLGFVLEEKGGLKVRIPVLEKFLEEKLEKMTRLRFVGDEVLAGEVNIDAQLTEQEKRVLRVLVNASGRVVSRDGMAEAMWEKDVVEKYSDWAIDKMMSRLRGKLKLWGSGEVKTVKGRGFSLVVK